MRKISEKWCLESWHVTRNNVGFTFHQIFYAMQRCLIGPLRVMKCGVFNTTQKQNDEACSGKHRIHLRQKSTHVSVAGQDHACVFLRSQGNSSLWIHCTRTNDKSTVLFKCWQGYRNLFAGDPDSSLTSGFSTMKMPLHMMCYKFVSSWLRTPLQNWTIHLIHLN